MYKKEAVHSSTTASSLLFKRYTTMVALLLIVSSISSLSSVEHLYASEFNAAYVNAASLQSSILADGQGYLTKVNPQTHDGDRSTMNDHFVHTVKSGETLSTIAASYGINTSTLMWENNLSQAQLIRSGQELSIPPVNGVSHTIKKGETVEKLATAYGVDAEAIRKQNNLVASTLAIDDKIFIPDAEPIAPPQAAPVRTTPTRSGTTSRAVAASTPVTLVNSDTAPVSGKPFIFPTRGKLTQGFRPGHYAVDIADSSRPPVWAAGPGTVMKASAGTWGGGYGNHVIIDHGNGLQTLYAHLDQLYVSVGERVAQGQNIGKMGNTGRVYGRTGIHLHFEVIQNGVKQIPSNFY